MAKFETTDYAQMRRCRMAHLLGQMVDEHFNSSDAGDVMVSGYVHMVSPNLTCWPLRWTITVEAKSVDQHVEALALAD